METEELAVGMIGRRKSWDLPDHAGYDLLLDTEPKKKKKLRIAYVQGAEMYIHII